SKYVALRTGPSEAPLAFVVCRDCGTAEQIPIDETSKTLFANALACGFQDLDATIEITGRCKGHDDAQTG
ncbi:MAG: hypothetical protein MRY64_03920, partial [Hyphomonadaceae bacterium]|nr:hypothetical protein [Hyphomonadaceae bacterium]